MQLLVAALKDITKVMEKQWDQLCQYVLLHLIIYNDKWSKTASEHSFLITCNISQLKGITNQNQRLSGGL